MIGREFTIDDGAARHDLGYVCEMSREAGRQMYLDAIEAAKKKESATSSSSVRLTAPASFDRNSAHPRGGDTA